MGDDLPLPDGYAELLTELKTEVRATQQRTRLRVNDELLGLYWRIGKAILARQSLEGWGAKVINRLAVDLQAEFPGMKGWSARNLRYMRQFAAAIPDGAIGQQAVAQLPWGHVMVLLDRLDDPADRQWYAERCASGGWSRAVLLDRVKGQLHLREGSAPSNFEHALPAGDSDLAQQLAKDPYTFDFLGVTDTIAERDLEARLIDQIERFLLELGTGFAFVARQYRFAVGGDDFIIDLLFFHYHQNRFVVVELKAERFRPEHTGQLGMYVAWVDGNLRGIDHAATVGILICADKNNSVVRYALGGTAAPMAVATFTYESLPDSAQRGLPTADALVGAVAAHADRGPRHVR